MCTRIWIYLFLFLALSSCKKEVPTVYELNPVSVRKGGAKTNFKTDLQLVSIAYADLFGKQIGTQELNVLIDGYKAVGDKSLVIDLIIRNMLNNQEVIKPSTQTMRGDIEKFLFETYERFFNRNPNELELWFFKDLIEKNPELLPEDIYYALMSSEEYRFY